LVIKNHDKTVLARFHNEAQNSYDAGWLPLVNSWDSSDPLWVDNGLSNFTHSRSVGGPATHVNTFDVSGLVEGHFYDINIIASGLTGESNFVIWLGEGWQNIRPLTDGPHTFNIQYLGETYPEIWLETPISVVGGGFTIQLVSFIDTTEPNLDTYYAYPFTVTLPDSLEGQETKARLAFTNVDRQLIDSIREEEEHLWVDIEVVLSSDGSQMAFFPDMELRNISYNTAVITGDLSYETFLREPYPKDIMSGRWFPGLFRK